MQNKIGVVIVAAGKGTRMGQAVSKQYLPLAGKPIFVHTLQTFATHPQIDSIAIVVPTGDEKYVRQLVEQYECRKVDAVIAGGAERQHSVLRGLFALGEGIDLVLVHDAVRPFTTHETIDKVLREAVISGAAVTAVPVKDTIKIADEDGIVQSTPNRQSLWAVQTPQAFRLSLLIAAYEQAERDGYVGTDDASLVERLGSPVKLVQGEYTNLKITTPEDLHWAEHYINDLMNGRGQDDTDRTRL